MSFGFGALAHRNAKPSLWSTMCVCCQDDDDAGKEEDQGGFNDLYDMDDDFIDDDELQDYYGGDRRKTKYSGFFINKARVATGPFPHTFSQVIRF